MFLVRFMHKLGSTKKLVFYDISRHLYLNQFFVMIFGATSMQIIELKEFRNRKLNDILDLIVSIFILIYSYSVILICFSFDDNHLVIKV